MNNPDLLLTNFHLMTMDPATDDSYGLVRDGALIVREGHIAWLGKADDPEARGFKGSVIQGEGRFLSPGLIDCHTHLVWAGSRANEWEQRLTGVRYEEIAHRGGGILSTVAATRSATAEELYKGAYDRIRRLISQGVTTVEIKSGYGLDLATELKMLQVATTLRDSLPVDVQRTFLGAHALPAEYAGRQDEYVDLVCDTMIPAVKEHCEAVDVFCEGIGFSRAQTRRIFQAAQSHELHLKVHAEQLSHLGGAKLAAEMGALSADHLEYLTDADANAMASSGTVAVLLPGAFYFLRETQQPPVEALRRYGVAIAIATDANPGSSPCGDLLLMANMACTLFGLPSAEAFAGITRNAAAALGMQDRLGTLAVGKQADLAAWDIDSPAELAYGIGHNPCQALYKRGVSILERV